ncbi:hypothetical protein CANCADRAFT_31712, partial [Tortispora caseinolytica NRRL Y-17796]
GIGLLGADWNDELPVIRYKLLHVLAGSIRANADGMDTPIIHYYFFICKSIKDNRTKAEISDNHDLRYNRLLL